MFRVDFFLGGGSGRLLQYKIFLALFLSVSENLLQDASGLYSPLESVDNSEIVHKTCSNLVWGAVPTEKLWKYTSVRVSLSKYMHKHWRRLTCLGENNTEYQHVKFWIQFMTNFTNLRLLLGILFWILNKHSVQVWGKN